MVKQVNSLSLFSKNNLQPPTKFYFEMSSMLGRKNYPCKQFQKVKRIIFYINYFFMNLRYFKKIEHKSDKNLEDNETALLTADRNEKDPKQRF